MKRLNIDLLDYDFVAFLKAPKSEAPEGIRIEGPMMVDHASADAPGVPEFIMLSVAIPVAINILTSYLYDYLTKRGTKRIRIQREDILMEDKERFIRIVRENIQIDQ